MIKEVVTEWTTVTYWCARTDKLVTKKFPAKRHLVVEKENG